MKIPFMRKPEPLAEGNPLYFMLYKTDKSQGRKSEGCTYHNFDNSAYLGPENPATLCLVITPDADVIDTESEGLRERISFAKSSGLITDKDLKKCGITEAGWSTITYWDGVPNYMYYGDATREQKMKEAFEKLINKLGLELINSN